jgi:broad specificity phosphatase PhoE
VSTLLLIRHGQASFGAADYDVLSERGIEQSRTLGRWLIDRGERIDALYAGPRRRQIDTARHLASAAADAGAPLPPVITIDELDEFPAIELGRIWLPRLSTEDPALAAELASADPAEQGRAIMRAFDLLTGRWWRGELDSGDLESFAAFRDRVARGLARVMTAEGRGRRALCVTSGGPISIAIQQCLALADAVAFRLATVIANASTTELRWRGTEVTLFGFNQTAHLSPSTITLR